MTDARWLVDATDKTDLDAKLASTLLARWRFGYRAGEPGQFKLDLPSLHPHSELWKSSGKQRFGQIGASAFAGDDELTLCELTLHEDEGGGLIRTTLDAYRRMFEMVASSPHQHLLRTWCYFSAINFGEGEAERYKQFCVGRARAIGDKNLGVDPAATVIGRVGSSSPWLHLVWLCGKRPGLAIDNVRQRQPKLYSVQFGAEPPRFSRGMLLQLARGPVLLISGTASIIDEQSRHTNDLTAQFHEAVRNLTAVLHAGCQALNRPHVGFGDQSVLRAYVRHEDQQFNVHEMLQKQFPLSKFCVIAGDVCRRELLIELEAVHHF